MLVIPLRAPKPLDLKRSLAEWLDTARECEFESPEVLEDLQRLSRIRKVLCNAGSDPASALRALPAYKDYHAALLECEQRGFPTHDTADTRRCLALTWESMFPEKSSPETGYNLTWERANVLWNVAALQSFEASQQSTTKAGWNQTARHFEAAASTLHHLRELHLPYGRDFASTPFWELCYLAEAQIAKYYLARCSPKPQHYLLAKMAIGAVPVLNEAAEACENLSNSIEWKQYCHAWSVFIAAAAEYHEACHHRGKEEYGMELARLERAREYSVICQDFVYGSISHLDSLSFLKDQLVPMIQWIRDCTLDAKQKNQFSQQIVPGEVREIVGELLAKSNLPLAPDMKTPLNMFGSVLAVEARRAVESFTNELDRLVYEMTSAVDEHTEKGRRALADVNLPHSLTTYEQEQSGGGIPMELWDRIEAVQRERRLASLKQDIWHLRDAADEAQVLFRKISDQLAEDVELDALFRQQHPSFQGHDVLEVQRTFESSLDHYGSLLTKSRDGDGVLIRRVDRMSADPKFSLLQLQKADLDRLIPAGDSSRGGMDTSHLRRLLVDLSALYGERKDMLQALKESANTYNIRSTIAELDPNSTNATVAYENIVRSALRSFDGFVYDLRFNLDKQAGIVDRILEENDRFMSAQEAIAGSAAISSDNCIVRIEDAMEELEQLIKHIKEGCGFYRILMPKLSDLQQQVGDVSTRLALERLDYQDQCVGGSSSQRRRQEEEDARMAASLMAGGSEDDPPKYSPMRDRAPASSLPGVLAISHVDTPPVFVDDEKVASLVSMEFDPEKVVAALKRHDNNMERALNDLLMS